MAFIITVQDILNESDPNLRRTIRTIFEHMQSLRRRDSYSNYAPHLDFSSPESRTVVGKACGAIWDYCDENGLPWLNLLVVNSQDKLPGVGIIKWYEEQYETLQDYDRFCELHAEIAELMLQNGNIEIIL